MGRELITFDNVHYEKQVGTLPDGVDAKMVTGHLAERSGELDENLKGSLGELVKNAAYRARSGRVYIDMDTSRPLTRGDMPKVNICVMDVHGKVADTFNRETANGFANGPDGRRPFMSYQEKTAFSVKMVEKDDDGIVGRIEDHDRRIKGGADDSFEEAIIHLHTDSSYIYGLRVPSEGFRDLPYPDPENVEHYFNQEAFRVEDILKEFGDVRNVGISHCNSMYPESAYISFQSDALMDIYGIADRIEEYRTQNMGNELGEALGSMAQEGAAEL